MKTIVVKNSDEACKKASDIICSVVRDNKNALLGLATGGTAEGVYKYIVEEFKNGKIDLSNVKTINLDEYVGIGGIILKVIEGIWMITFLIMLI